MTDPNFSERRTSHRGRESPFPSDRERGGFAGGRPGTDLRTTDPPNENALEVRPVLDTGYNDPAPTCNWQRMVAHPGRVQTTTAMASEACSPDLPLLRRTTTRRLTCVVVVIGATWLGTHGENGLDRVVLEADRVGLVEVEPVQILVGEGCKIWDEVDGRPPVEGEAIARPVVSSMLL